MRTVVIVAGCQSYRTEDFLTAASALRLDARVATDAPPPIEDSDGQIEVDLDDPAVAGAQIASSFPDADAVVGIDDEAVKAAAAAAAAIGLPHNPMAAVGTTRDKLAMRRALDAAGVSQPRFVAAGPGRVPESAESVGYPVVVKPVALSASRGVIRVDRAAHASKAESRIRNILSAAGRDPTELLVVEEYVPGAEVVVEGLLTDGELEVLAVIDKPESLEGPYFEETMFVTPSRHTARSRRAVIDLAQGAATAIGLRMGPVHVEVRIAPDGSARLIEIAARSIGGLCGRSLTFGLLGESLEVAILRAALGRPNPDTRLTRSASGVMMLPILATGVLTGVENLEAARRIPGIDDIAITAAEGRRVVALPEGDRYLGFVFASGTTPDDVESSLREAAATLVVTIDGEQVETKPEPSVDR